MKLQVVHGVAHDNFQRLANHIRLNHVVSGFQRLNEPEDNRFIGQMTFGGQNTAYCSRKQRTLQQNDRLRDGSIPTAHCLKTQNDIRVEAEYFVSFVLTVAVNCSQCIFFGSDGFPLPNNGTILSRLSLRGPSLFVRPCAVLRRVKAMLFEPISAITTASVSRRRGSFSCSFMIRRR